MVPAMVPARLRTGLDIALSARNVDSTVPELGTTIPVLLGKSVAVGGDDDKKALESCPFVMKLGDTLCRL